MQSRACEWFIQEYHTYEVLHKFFECHDDAVTFFAYEKLLFLQGVLNHWCIDTESVPIAEDALVWITPAALPLLEHHRPGLSGCVPMDDQVAEAIAASGSFEDSDDESEHTVEQV